MNLKKAILISLGIFICGSILLILGISINNMLIGFLGLGTMLFSLSPIVVFFYRFLQKRFTFLSKPIEFAKQDKKIEKAEAQKELREGEQIQSKSLWEKPLTKKGVLFYIILIIIFGYISLRGFFFLAEQISQPTSEKPAEGLPKFLSFICSKPENSLTSFYYLITSYCPTNQSFTLPEKITDVTVRLSTIQGKAGWDTNFLCSPETEFDLPSYQWQILTVGSDCGLGAKISPCDTNFISDSTGVTGIIIRPDIKGYTSGVMGKYCKKDALLKVTGKIVK